MLATVRTRPIHPVGPERAALAVFKGQGMIIVIRIAITATVTSIVISIATSIATTIATIIETNKKSSPNLAS